MLLQFRGFYFVRINSLFPKSVSSIANNFVSLNILAKIFLCLCLPMQHGVILTITIICSFTTRCYKVTDKIIFSLYLGLNRGPSDLEANDIPMCPCASHQMVQHCPTIQIRHKVPSIQMPLSSETFNNQPLF